MTHRKQKYASQFKQDKINDLSFSGSEGRRAIVNMATREQWEKRFNNNVRGFWKAEKARS